MIVDFVIEHTVVNIVPLLVGAAAGIVVVRLFF